MSGYKYSWPSDYLDPIPPTAIKKWGRSGLPGRDNCLWGGQEGKVGEGPKGVRRRDVCTCVSVCAHSFSVQCGGDGLDAQEEMPSVQEVCVHNLTHKQPSLRQPLWDALPQLSGGLGGFSHIWTPAH